MKPSRLGRRAEVSGGEVAFEVLGKGLPVVLIHGTPSRFYIWRKVAPALAGQFSVYVFDLLGYGSGTVIRGRAATMSP